MLGEELFRIVYDVHAFFHHAVDAGGKAQCNTYLAVHALVGDSGAIGNAFLKGLNLFRIEIFDFRPGRFCLRADVLKFAEIVEGNCRYVLERLEPIFQGFFDVLRDLDCVDADGYEVVDTLS